MIDHPNGVVEDENTDFPAVDDDLGIPEVEPFDPDDVDEEEAQDVR